MWLRKLGLMIAVLIATAMPALAVDTRDIGGTGGGWFRDECNAGDVLVGINVQAAKDLGTVGAVCSPMRDGRVVDQPYGLHTWGHAPDFGVADDFLAGDHAPRCLGDNAVFSINASVSSHSTIHDFSLGCRDLVTGAETQTGVSETNGGQGFNHEVVGCEPGTIATGLKGRAGSLIDALGLICSPLPAPPQAQQPAPQQPSGPPQKPIKSTGKGGQNTAPANNGPNLKPTDNGAGGNANDNGGGNDNGGNNNVGGGATAAVDTTIYDQPAGNDLAYLSAGDPVTIVSCNDDNWCKISAPRKGWVWGDDLDR